MTQDATLRTPLLHALRGFFGRPGVLAFVLAFAVVFQAVFTAGILFHALRGGAPRPYWLASMLALADLASYAAILAASLLLAARLPVDRRRPFPAIVGVAAAFLALVAGKAWWMLLVRGWLGVPTSPYPLHLLDWCGPYFHTIAGIVGAGYALLHVLREQERRLGVARLEAEVEQARLRALKGRLRPPFLFDTLAAVRGRVRGDRAGAERLLAQLGEMLRLTFRAAEADLATLQQEVGFALLFLEIEATRGAAPLHVRAALPPALRAAAVPHASLFPLVEAAAAGAGGQASRVEIGAGAEGGRLTVEVRDTGRLPLAARRRHPAWEGVERLRERLAALPGAPRLEMVDAPGGGVAATLVLPLGEAAA